MVVATSESHRIGNDIREKALFRWRDGRSRRATARKGREKHAPAPDAPEVAAACRARAAAESDVFAIACVKAARSILRGA
jgi:hypothetical protein